MELSYGRGLFHNTTQTFAYKYAEHGRQCIHKPDREPRSRNHCCRRKARRITYSDCLSVVSVIQHAKRMRRIILQSLPGLALPYFTTLTHTRQDFPGGGGGEFTSKKQRVFFFLYFFF